MESSMIERVGTAVAGGIADIGGENKGAAASLTTLPGATQPRAMA